MARPAALPRALRRAPAVSRSSRTSIARPHALARQPRRRAMTPTPSPLVARRWCRTPPALTSATLIDDDDDPFSLCGWTSGSIRAALTICPAAASGAPPARNWTWSGERALLPLRPPGFGHYAATKSMTPHRRGPAILQPCGSSSSRSAATGPTATAASSRKTDPCVTASTVGSTERPHD